MTRNDQILKMTKKELEDLPIHEDWANDIIARSIVLLPQKKRHDSGFTFIDFVAVQEDGMMIHIHSHVDVIHFNGIGGLGMVGPVFQNAITHNVTPVVAWSIDCLPKSRLLRIFCAAGNIVIGERVSSQCIYPTQK